MGVALGATKRLNRIKWSCTNMSVGKIPMQFNGGQNRFKLFQNRSNRYLIDLDKQLK